MKLFVSRHRPRVRSLSYSFKLGCILGVFVIVACVLTLIRSNHRYSLTSPSPSLSFSHSVFGEDAYTGTLTAVDMRTSLRTNGDGAVVAVARSDSSVQFVQPMSGVRMQSEGKNLVTFAGSSSSTTFQYSLVSNGLKENIVLKERPTSPRFTSVMTTNNLVLNKSSEGVPVFTDQRGVYQFHFQRPYATDAAGNKTYAVTYKISPNKDIPVQQISPKKSGKQHLSVFGMGTEHYTDSTYTITTEVDPKWLLDPKRIYPVTIDPTVVHNTSATFATGTLNRVFDAGSGSSPALQDYFQELQADANTVGLWHLNETSGSSAADSSGNGNTGTATGTTIITTGQFLGAGARSFNGSSDLISVPNANNLNSSIFTVEVWVKTTDAGTNRTIVSKPTGCLSNGYLIWLNQNGSAGAGVPSFDPGSIWLDSKVSINDGAWHHVAAVYDGSIAYIYVDGILRNSAVTSLAAASSNPLTIGGTTVCGNYLNGSIDEVRISNIARSAEEIRADAMRRPYAVYTSPVIDLGPIITASFNGLSWNEAGVETGSGETASNSASLVAQWNFNETSGNVASVATGSCGSTCNGFLVNFNDLTGQDTLATGSGWTSINRKWGAGALMFDGIKNYVSIPDTALLSPGTGDYTINSWFKTNTSYSGAQGIIYSNIGSASNNLINLELNTSNFGKCLFRDGSNNSITVIGSTALNNGVWHNMVCVKSSTTLFLYVDSILVATKSNGSLGTITTTGRSKTIGTHSQTLGTENFNGTIDAVQVYTRALPAAEILSNYNAANLEMQTRVGNTTTPDDGTWEAWKPTTSETQIDSMDNVQGWATPSSSVWPNVPIATSSSTVIKMEGNGALRVQTQGQVDPSTLALWHFDETGGSGAYFKDASANGNTMTPNGTTSVAGVIGQARSFNGSTDYLTASVSASILGLGSNSFTFEFWLYDAGSANGTGVLSIGVPASATEANLIYINGNTLYYYSSSNGSTWDIVNGLSFGSLPLAQWTHFAVTRNGSLITTYKNGVLQNTTTSAAASLTATVMNIGKRVNNATPFMLGRFDELRILNRGLTASEVAESYRLGRDHRLSLALPSTDLSTKTKVPFWVASDRPGRFMEATVGQSAFANYEGDATTAGLWHFDENASAPQSQFDDARLVFTDTFPGTSLNTTEWTKIDPNNNKISVNSGLVLSAGTVVAWDSGIISNQSFTNTTGNVLYAKYTTGASVLGNNAMMVGWGQDQFASASYTTITHAFYFGNDGVFHVYQDGTNTVNPGNAFVANTTYEVKITLLSSGSAKYEVKGGAYGSWTTIVAADTAKTNSAFRAQIATYQMVGTMNQISVYQTTQTKDSSGNGNHGSPFGTTTAITSVQGMMGRGYNFNGTSDYIDVGAVPTIASPSAMTVSGWFRETALATNMAIASRWDYQTAGGWNVSSDSVTSSELISMIASTLGEAGNNYCRTVGAGITAGTWYHLAVVFDGTQSGNANRLKIYLNGTLVNTSCTGTIPAVILQTPASVKFGKFGGSLTRLWNGSLDEMRIDNVARTADQIRQAFEVGKRTFPIVIDFRATLGSTNVISNSSDLSFDVNATTSGAMNNADFLYPGDKIIVKENYNGTEYLAQGTVSTVNHTSGATVVTSWDAGSTFPAGGYSPNASVFKWQKEWADVSGALPAHLTGTTRLTIRLNDGSMGENIWLDDLRGGGAYLAAPSGSTVTSSIGSRYFQYRSILSTSDATVSATLQNVSISYTSNAPPNTPSLDLPSNGAISQLLSPVLKTTATDPDSDYVRYKIVLCTNAAMTTGCQTFDQTSSQTGWSGQNTQASTAYTSGTQAVYTVQTPLTGGVTYYWQSYAIDPAGTNSWGTTQGSPFSFTTNAPPTTPTSLQTNGLTNPTGLAPGSTPTFSAIYNDVDTGDTTTQAQIQVTTDSTFTGSITNWDSGWVTITSTAIGARSPNITYAGGTLAPNTTFYWRIRFKDNSGNVGAWGSAQFSTTQLFTPPCTLVRARDNSSITVQWVDNNTIEDGYTIQKNTDGGGFSAYTTTAANGTNVVDSTISIGHTYAYRVKATSGSQSSDWCTTSTISLLTGSGNPINSLQFN